MLKLYDFVGSKERIVLSAANRVFVAELLFAENQVFTAEFKLSVGNQVFTAEFKLSAANQVFAVEFVLCSLLN
jgi:hypothetical protein